MTVPIVDDIDQDHYWLGSTDTAIRDTESLMRDYPMEWTEAVKQCWQDHEAMYQRKLDRKRQCEAGNHEECWDIGDRHEYGSSAGDVWGPEGIRFAGYLIEGPDIGAYPCSECGNGDHFVCAMQYSPSGAGAIYGVHSCNGIMKARCYAD